MNELIISGAGGGGCFPAGTLVNTPTGRKAIESLVVGDEVYAFDISSYYPGEVELPGKVKIAKISQTFIHSFGEVGYTSPLLIIKHTDGELVVTGNHYILCETKQSTGADVGFARADELEVNDVLFTEYGEKVTITSIENGSEYDFVYNLEVEDFHTYIASKIRVHNGGGGKGNQGRPAIQAPNSVRTNQIVRVLLCPGEGEGVGLWDTSNPAKSVFFDGTPLQNSDGTYNFTNITVNQRVGTPSQTVIPGFSAVEAETVVGQTITTSASITRTISTSDIDAVRVTLEFPSGLQSISTENGDANGTSVQLRISTRVTAGTFATIIEPTIAEMSSGPFTVSYLIPRPTAAGTWEFRVQRLTADSSANNLINATALKSYTEIQNVSLTYDNRMLVALTVGADSTNGRIPNIALDVGGHKVQVPNNYNASTRAYSGSWSGTLTTTPVFTDNPAWLLYDLITNDRYGMGLKIADSLVDKFSFYTAGVYCDELVDDGKGTGTFEPRFTFNAQLMVREDAWKTLQAIASSFNAMLYLHSGMVRISQDAPGTATKLISNSNVINGDFVYTSTALEDRFTACNVTFNDPTDNFLPKTISEVSSTGVARYGYQSQDVLAYGATTEGQARRAAKWVIDTSINTTRFIEFNVGLEHADFEPGEIFKVLDVDYAQVLQEGRLISASGTTLVLDKPLTKTTGTWTIDLTSSDGASIETRTITSGSGTSSTITISSAGGATGGTYIITGVVSPQQFRCVSLSEGESGNYSVKGVFYDPTKYARVESGITIPTPVYFSSTRLTAVDVPTSLVITPISTTTPEGFIDRKFNLSWTPPADGTAASYRIAYRKDFGPIETLTSLTPFARIPAGVSGNYEFYINAINSAGVVSPTLSGSYSFDITNGTGSSIGTPTSLGLLGGGTSYGNSTMALIWTAPTAVFGINLKDYEVKLWTTSGGTNFKTVYTTDTYYNYSYSENLADGGPRSSIYVTVKARDTENKTGTAATNTFTSVTSASVTNLIVRGTGGGTFATRDLEVTWTADATGGVPFKNDPNFDYFRVEVFNGSTLLRTEQTADNNYTYTFEKNVLDNGANTPLGGIVLRVTTVNKFGVTGASATSTFTAANPPAVTGLVVPVTGSVFTQPDLNLVWSCLTAGSTPYSNTNVFKHFKVRVYNAAVTLINRTRYVADEAFNYSIFENREDNGTAIRVIYVQVSAVSIYGTEGTLGQGPFTNAAQGTPANLQVQGGLGSIKVTFDYPPDSDYAGSYIWGSTTNGFTPSSSNLLATITGSYASLTPLPDDTTYYIRVGSFDTFDKSTSGTGMNLSAQSSVTTSPTAGIPSFSTSPGSGTEGDVYFNTTDGQLYRYHSGAWTVYVPTSALTGQITTTQITDNSITTAKVAANAITANEIAANAITAGKIAANAVTSGTVVAGSITGDRLVANTITADRIAAGTITADRMVTNTITAASGILATASVGTANIIDANITTAKIADLAVDNAKIANLSVDAAKIANATITNGKIANAAIGTANIIDANITTAKIANLAVGTAQIGDLSVNTLKIANRAVSIPTISINNDGLQTGYTPKSYGAGPNTALVITTASFTCTGQPVRVDLQVDTHVNTWIGPGPNGIAGHVAGTYSWTLYILLDGVEIRRVVGKDDMNFYDETKWRALVLPWFVIQPAAGNHNIQLHYHYYKSSGEHFDIQAQTRFGTRAIYTLELLK